MRLDKSFRVRESTELTNLDKPNLCVTLLTSYSPLTSSVSVLNTYFITLASSLANTIQFFNANNFEIPTLSKLNHKTCSIVSGPYQSNLIQLRNAIIGASELKYEYDRISTISVHLVLSVVDSSIIRINFESDSIRRVISYLRTLFVRVVNTLTLS